MWTWKDVDEQCLEHLVEDFPCLVRFIQAVETIHGKPMKAYLTYMVQRIIEMRRVLKPTGSIYLHCDPTASHYLKIVMDQIFGKNNFRNELIWGYPASPSAAVKDFPRKHDVILRYVKSHKNWCFNADAVRVSYSEASQHRARYAANASKVMYGTEIKLNELGKIPPTIWIDIQQAYRYRNEKTGYPTQKPLALLNRIIKASSNEGDLVLDPFCGCATTCVAAHHLKRRWIGIDISETAKNLVAERLSDEGGFFTDFVHLMKPPVRTDLEKCSKESVDVKNRLYEAHNGKCNACGVEMEIRHLEVDHVIPRAKNGGDYYENYQLLCGHCNRVKGDRPMEYLLTKIRHRHEVLSQRVSF